MPPVRRVCATDQVAWRSTEEWTNLVLEDARLALPDKLLLHRVAHALDELVVIQELNLALGRVDVDVYGPWVNVQAGSLWVQ